MNTSDNQIIELPSFVLQGLYAKVNPLSGASEVIGKLWEEFTSGDYANKIPEMTRGIILTLYTDYISHDKSAYTVYVGCKVSEDLEVVTGLTRIEIPEAKYAMFLARGLMPEAAMEAWQRINTMDLPRAFAADYDLYGPKSQNQEHSEVEIFVSIH